MPSKQAERQDLLQSLTCPSEALEDWLGRAYGGRTWRAPEEVSRRVGEILAAVESRGDDALLEWTNRLDKRKLTDPAQLRVSDKQAKEALKKLPADVADALRMAQNRIQEYHGAERTEHNSWQHSDRLGVSQGRILKPVRSAGVYVPGGQASYPSSVLMNLVPARVAGVPRCLLCSPWPEDNYRPETLAAAHLAGCEEIYSLGGAVAIAAMAFGTDTITAVDVVAGPGNIWVAEAKRQVFGFVGVDMLAGPSEVVIIADETAQPAWVAADLCAQAEHDPQARAILISDSEQMLDAVQAELLTVVPTLERSKIIDQSLREQGAAILVASLDQALEISNRIAPEHLQLAVNMPDLLLEQVECAGAVFLGHASGEVFGDYITGSNHVLPTGGTARFSSALGVSSFMTQVAFVNCPTPAAAALSEPTRVLACAEGLTAHALAASLRTRPAPPSPNKDGEKAAS